MSWTLEESGDGVTESRLTLISPSGHRFTATFPMDEVGEESVESRDYFEALKEARRLMSALESARLAELERQVKVERLRTISAEVKDL